MPSKVRNKLERAQKVLEQAAECAQRRSQGTPSEIAKRLGISQQTLGDRLRLHDAPDKIKSAAPTLGVAVIQHLLRHYPDDHSFIMELICGAIKPNGQIDEVGYEDGVCSGYV